MKIFRKINDEEWVEYEEVDWSNLTFKDFVGFMIMVIVFAFVCVSIFCGICYFITYYKVAIPITIGFIFLWYGGLGKYIKKGLYWLGDKFFEIFEY